MLPYPRKNLRRTFVDSMHVSRLDGWVTCQNRAGGPSVRIETCRVELAWFGLTFYKNVTYDYTYYNSDKMIPIILINFRLSIKSKNR